MCWEFKSLKPNVKQMYIHTSDTDMAEISCLIKAKVRIDVLGWEFKFWKQMYNHTSYNVMAEISCMIKTKVRIDVLGIQVLKAKCQANVHPHIWHWYSRDFLFDISCSFIDTVIALIVS